MIGVCCMCVVCVANDVPMRSLLLSVVLTVSNSSLIVSLGRCNNCL